MEQYHNHRGKRARSRRLQEAETSRLHQYVVQFAHLRHNQIILFPNILTVPLFYPTHATYNNILAYVHRIKHLPSIWNNIVDRRCPLGTCALLCKFCYNYHPTSHASHYCPSLQSPQFGTPSEPGTRFPDNDNIERKDLIDVLSFAALTWIYVCTLYSHSRAVKIRL